MGIWVLPNGWLSTNIPSSMQNSPFTCEIMWETTWDGGDATAQIVSSNEYLQWETRKIHEANRFSAVWRIMDNCLPINSMDFSRCSSTSLQCLSVRCWWTLFQVCCLEELAWQSKKKIQLLRWIMMNTVLTNFILSISLGTIDVGLWFKLYMLITAISPIFNGLSLLSLISSSHIWKCHEVALEWTLQWQQHVLPASCLSWATECFGHL